MELIAQHPELAYIAILLLFGLATFLLKRELVLMDRRLTKLEENQNSMRDNYIDRFDELKDLLHNIDKKVGIVSQKVTDQKDFCEKVQRAKEIR